jgi:MoxR-like ATPase
MKYQFYLGSGTRDTRAAQVRLPQSRQVRLMQPEHYLADPGLTDACNVALLLGQPLLLTGEPGTGKTQFASSLAWELGLDTPLKFETKSNSAARDLFYTYDSLKRFQDAQSGAPAGGPLLYLTYRALGIAILRSCEPDEVATFVPTGFVHGGKRRSIVLIDEIDKAPRDFPNDMLNELEQLYFRVPELGDVQIEADPELRPVVVITSNSEKDLPDAFLRRCVYYHIAFPDRARLAEIVAGRLGTHNAVSSAFLDDALSLFYQLRDQSSGLRKKPATAELLGWLLALQALGDGLANPLERSELAEKTVGVLIKTEYDLKKAMEIVRRWSSNRGR